MKQVIIDHFISYPRYERYFRSCQNNHENAREAYCLNLMISKSFYPLLSLVEIALRNKLDLILNQHFNDRNWILNQKNIFMADSKLGNKFLMKEQVIQAEKSLLRKHQNVQRQIITELSFAFWVRFFQSDYFGLLSAVPIKIFSHLPTNTKREAIHKRLKSVLDFRNRVYHNEQICLGIDRRQNFSIIDMDYAQEIYENINILLFWLGGPDLYDLGVEKIDNQSLITEFKKMNTLILKIGYGKPFALIP